MKCTPCLKRNPILRHNKGKQYQGENLGSIRLGTGHTYLRSCVDMHAAMGFSADGWSHSVGDSNDQSSTGFTIPKLQLIN